MGKARDAGSRLEGRTIPHVLPALTVVLGLLGAALLWQAGRLTHPRNLLDRPSGAWMTARERQQREATRKALRILGVAVLLVAVILLGVQVIRTLTT